MVYPSFNLSWFLFHLELRLNDRLKCDEFEPKHSKPPRQKEVH